MPLDEAALDTLGLSTLWVRRGASADRDAVAEAAPGDERETVSQARLSHEAVATAGGGEMPHESTAEPVSARTPEAPKPRESERAEGRRAIEQPDESSAWDDFAVESAALVSVPESHEAREPHEPRGTGTVATLDWDALEARVSACESCRLCEKRTKTVFGVGDRDADWMLIGEGPGENEDKQGEPFVGQAGKLLDNMLRALTLARGDNVYIANVVKCRPPGNRNPEPDEVARCEPYLQRQVALVKPKLIVALGRVAAQNLLKTDASISSLRGRVHRYEDVPVIVTYHPAYLLRSLHDKAKAWVDLCLAYDTYRQAVDEGQAAQ